VRWKDKRAREKEGEREREGGKGRKDGVFQRGRAFAIDEAKVTV
jgi:hypothetical protein